MKTNILYLCIAFSLTAACTHAQSTKSKKTGNEWHAAGDALPRSKAFAEKIKKDLKLDDATTQKAFQTYLANTKTVDEIKLGGGSENQIKESLKMNKAEFDEKMKAILSNEQYKKYLTIKE